MSFSRILNRVADVREAIKELLNALENLEWACMVEPSLKFYVPVLFKLRLRAKSLSAQVEAVIREIEVLVRPLGEVSV